MGNAHPAGNENAPMNIPQNNLNVEPSEQMRNVYLHFGQLLGIGSVFWALHAHDSKMKKKDEEEIKALKLKHEGMKLTATVPRAQKYSSPSPGDVIRMFETNEEITNKKHTHELKLYANLLREILDIKCSWFRDSNIRKRRQNELLKEVERSKLEVTVNRDDLYDIFSNDDAFCGSSPETNGRLRHVYMKLWKARIDRDMYKNIVEQMKKKFPSEK